jgi:PST family polysaccharide transporter
MTWPMGFIIVAKNEQKIFFLVELAWTVVNVGLAWLCIRSFGVNGAGLAFFGSYVFHWFLIYPIVRQLSEFRWSPANSQTSLLFLASITVVFCGFYVLPPIWATSIGALAVILSGLYSLRILLDLVSYDRVPHTIQRLLLRVRPTISAC